MIDSELKELAHRAAVEADGETSVQATDAASVPFLVEIKRLRAALQKLSSGDDFAPRRASVDEELEARKHFAWESIHG